MLIDTNDINAFIMSGRHH